MLRALIVDDELPAREELTYLLKKAPYDIQITDTGSTREALEFIAAEQPDVVFLDIRMPGISGIRMAEAFKRISHPPRVVFVTAYPAHATNAFELDALDFLLKPVDERRLVITLERLNSALENQKYDRFQEILTSKIRVHTKKTDALITPEAIDYIEGMLETIHLHVRGQVFTLKGSLTEFEKHLPSSMFCRIHRNIIVNLQRVIRFDSENHVNHSVTLRTDPSEPQITLPVSRKRVEYFRSAWGVSEKTPKKGRII